MLLEIIISEIFMLLHFIISTPFISVSTLLFINVLFEIVVFEASVRYIAAILKILKY